jgi:hypothetical protein
MQRFQSIYLWKNIEKSTIKHQIPYADTDEFEKVKQINNKVFKTLYNEFLEIEENMRILELLGAKNELSTGESKMFDDLKSRFVSEIKTSSNFVIEVHNLYVLGENSVIKIQNHMKNFSGLFSKIKLNTRQRVVVNNQDVIRRLVLSSHLNVSNVVFHFYIPTEFSNDILYLKKKAELYCKVFTEVEFLPDKYSALQLKIRDLYKAVKIRDLVDMSKVVEEDCAKRGMVNTFWVDIKKLCLSKDLMKVKRRFENFGKNEELSLRYKKISISVYKTGYISVTGFKDAYSIRFVFGDVLKRIHKIVPNRERFKLLFCRSWHHEFNKKMKKSKKKIENDWAKEEMTLESCLNKNMQVFPKLPFKKSAIMIGGGGGTAAFKNSGDLRFEVPEETHSQTCCNVIKKLKGNWNLDFF